MEKLVIEEKKNAGFFVLDEHGQVQAVLPTKVEAEAFKQGWAMALLGIDLHSGETWVNGRAG